MEIHVKSDSKLVEVWLTNAEKQDTAIREKLKSLYRAYKEKKYLVAVFESGEGDLANATSDLLCYNRKRITQLEVQREKQQGMVMGR